MCNLFCINFLRVNDREQLNGELYVWRGIDREELTGEQLSASNWPDTPSLC